MTDFFLKSYQSILLKLNSVLVYLEGMFQQIEKVTKVGCNLFIRKLCEVSGFLVYFMRF